MSFLKLPTNMNSSFFNLVDTLDKIDRVLGPDAPTTSFRSIASYGIGGFSKCSVAAPYIEKKVEERVYDVVLWGREPHAWY